MHFNPFPSILQTLIWVPTRILLKTFLHLNVRGLENLQELEPGVIFAVNHLSELDPILLPATMNPLSKLMPMYYVSRDKSGYTTAAGFRKHLYGGSFFSLWGAYPAILGIRNYERSLAAHIELIKRGKSVCIFPEGKKSEDAGLQRPKGGIVELARQTGAPIVPVAVSGHFRMSKREFFLRKRYSMVSYGKPITVEDLFEGHGDPSPKQYEKIVSEKIIPRIASLLDDHMKERLLRKVRN